MKMMIRWCMVLILGCLSLSSVAQNYFGLSAGLNINQYTDFSKNSDYQSKYTPSLGPTVTLSYQNQSDGWFGERGTISINNYKLNATIENDFASPPFYSDMHYKIWQLSGTGEAVFSVVESDALAMTVSAGLYLGFNVSTTATGHGWNEVTQTVTDSSGNPVQVSVRQEWVCNEKRSDRLERISAGCMIGADLYFPLTVGIDLSVTNRYMISFHRSIKDKTLEKTIPIHAQVNVGLRFALF